MKRMKILGTTAAIPYKYLRKMENISSTKIPHNQFRIICKCKSMAEANRKCRDAGLSDKVFVSADTCETGNEVELSLCEKEDIWISVSNRARNNYTSLSELQQEDEQKQAICDC